MDSRDRYRDLAAGKERGAIAREFGEDIASALDTPERQARLEKHRQADEARKAAREREHAELLAIVAAANG